MRKGFRRVEFVYLVANVVLFVVLLYRLSYGDAPRASVESQPVPSSLPCSEFRGSGSWAAQRGARSSFCLPWGCRCCRSSSSTASEAEPEPTGEPLSGRRSSLGGDGRLGVDRHRSARMDHAIDGRRAGRRRLDTSRRWRCPRAPERKHTAPARARAVTRCSRIVIDPRTSRLGTRRHTASTDTSQGPSLARGR